MENRFLLLMLRNDKSILEMKILENIMLNHENILIIRRTCSMVSTNRPNEFFNVDHEQTWSVRSVQMLHPNTKDLAPKDFLLETQSIQSAPEGGK